MPAFVWKGKTRDGKVVIRRESRRQQGCGARLPPARAGSWSRRSRTKKARRFVLPKFGGGVPSKDLAIFTRQFSVMIDAGLPLVQCLEILGGQQENKTLPRSCSRPAWTWRRARAWPTPCASSPKAFDDLYTNMIAAGEAGGILDTILKRLATYIEKNVKLKAQVKGAMVLPGRRSSRSPASSSPSSCGRSFPPSPRCSRAWGRAAAPDQVRDRALQLAGPAAAVPRRRRRAAGGRLQALLRHPRGAAGRRRDRPQRPDLRPPDAQDRGRPLLPHPLHPDLLGRAHPRRAGDHGQDRGQRHRRRRHHERAQGRRGRPHRRPAAQGHRGLPADGGPDDRRRRADGRPRRDARARSPTSTRRRWTRRWPTS